MLFTASLFAVDFNNSKLGLTKSESNVLKREIVELDVNLRTQASLISFGNSYRLKASLAHTSRFVTESSPRYKKAFQALRRKLSQKGLLPYLLRVHELSKKLRIYLNNQHRLNRAVDWNKVFEQYKLILTNCRIFYIRAGLQ